MPAPDNHLATIGHRAKLLKLHLRLHAGAEDANGPDMGRRQQPGSDTPGQCGAHGSQPALVLQQCQRLTGVCRQHKHQAIIARQALGRVVVEACRKLDGEGRAAFDVGRLHATVTVRALECEALHGRHLHLAFGVGDEAFLQLADRELGVEASDDLRLAEDPH
ncbi:hypothetical protein D9M71_681930 [compost metagenome]